MGRILSDALKFRVEATKNARRHISRKEVARLVTERLQQTHPNKRKVEWRYIWRLESNRFKQVDKVILETIAAIYREAYQVGDISKIIYYDREE